MSERPVSSSDLPETLAGTYLGEAIDAIRNAGSADALYDDAIRSAAPADRNMTWMASAEKRAAGRRVNFSRAAMLFAAFAAEAYINEFITAHFAGQDRETMDRLPTVEKFAIAPRLALGRALFVRDRQPLQTIKRLFGERDQLVHPKPGKALPDADGWDADPNYNPTAAMTMAVAVAEAAELVLRERPTGKTFDLHSSLIMLGRRELIAYAKRATERLPLPEHAPETPYLILVAANQTGDT